MNPTEQSKYLEAFCCEYTEYLKILELIMEDRLVEAANSLRNWQAAHSESTNVSASLQGVIHRAFGRTELAAKSEQLALKLGRHAQSVSARARYLGNRAFVANELGLALEYYCIGMISDPCDMRLQLNVAAVHMCIPDFFWASTFAVRAILIGKFFGSPQCLIDKARKRYAAAISKMVYSLLRSSIEITFQISNAPTRWATIMRDNLALNDELAAEPVYEVEYDLAYAWAVLNVMPAKATEHLGAAIAVRPEAANTYAERAVCRLHLADWMAAMADAEVAIRLAHTDSLRARARWLQGLGLFGLERIREARQAFEAAAKLRPDVAIYAECADRLVLVNSESVEVFLSIVQRAAITKPVPPQ